MAEQGDRSSRPAPIVDKDPLVEDDEQELDSIQYDTPGNDAGAARVAVSEAPLPPPVAPPAPPSATAKTIAATRPNREPERRSPQPQPQRQKQHPPDSTSGSNPYKREPSPLPVVSTSEPAVVVAPSVERSTTGEDTIDTGFVAVPDWVRLHPWLGAILAETLGTFIYVLTIALVEINNPVINQMKETNIAPLPIGFMLVCVMFTFTYISGGHFNPAVTCAAFLCGKIPTMRSLAYVGCQCGAALAAGLVAMLIQGSEDIVVPNVENNGDFIRKGLFAELVFTFALTTVLLFITYSPLDYSPSPRNADTALADGSHFIKDRTFFSAFGTGMVVAAGVASVGGVSGGAFNPAAATGLQAAVCLAGRCAPLMHFWIHWTAPFIGAAVSALLFRSMHSLAQPMS